MYSDLFAFTFFFFFITGFTEGVKKLFNPSHKLPTFEEWIGFYGFCLCGAILNHFLYKWW